MTILTEGDLQIALPAGWTGQKFDDPASHRLSHCMKAVDFIIEANDQVFFVELKDPENPKSTLKETSAFFSDKMSDDLKTKYRDSWLYVFAEGRVNKPIYYLVLIAISKLSKIDLLTCTEALSRKIPLSGPGGLPWKKPFITHCAVMNLAAWNEAMPYMPISRIGQ